MTLSGQIMKLLLRLFKGVDLMLKRIIIKVLMIVPLSNIVSLRKKESVSHIVQVLLSTIPLGIMAYQARDRVIQTEAVNIHLEIAEVRQSPFCQRN